MEEPEIVFSEKSIVVRYVIPERYQDIEVLKKISKKASEFVQKSMEEKPHLEIELDFIRKVKGKVEGKHGFSFTEGEMSLLSSEINKLPWNIRVIFSDVYEYS